MNNLGHLFSPLLRCAVNRRVVTLPEGGHGAPVVLHIVNHLLQIRPCDRHWGLRKVRMTMMELFCTMECVYVGGVNVEQEEKFRFHFQIQ